MEYVGFQFKNFKGISDLDLPLTPGAVTTLIGLNESGKTTILEAIFCFSYGAENLDAIDPSMASLREPERWIPIARRGNFNDTIEISARIKLSDEDKRLLRQRLKKDFDIAIDEIDSELKITECYRFENSRHLPDNTSRTWSLAVSGTKGRQQKPREYDSDTQEWQGAIAFLTSRSRATHWSTDSHREDAFGTHLLLTSYRHSVQEVAGCLADTGFKIYTTVLRHPNWSMKPLRRDS